MLNKFSNRIEFDSYEDFKSNYKVNIPDGFNFAYDVVDAWAKKDINKKALLYCNDDGARITYTFDDMRKLSNKAANFFASKGITKGDRVMLMLKQRPEAWICILALCKLGAVCIPATYQLTTKDIIYRCNAARVKMIVAVNDENIINSINEATKDCGTLNHVALVGDNISDSITITVKASGVVIDEEDGNKIMEVRRLLYKRQDRESIV